MNRWLQSLGLMKNNYNNKVIPAGAGIILVLISIFGWSFYLYNDIGNSRIIEKLIFLSLIIGLTGLLDDMVGENENKGLKGHFTSFLQGNLTTGSVKVIIFILSIFLVIISEKSSYYAIIINSLLILFTTNIYNLFDLRPGRVIKVFLISSIFLYYIFNIFTYFFLLYLVLLPYFYLELKEKFMLGDAGSNFLGVITGYGLSRWNNLQGKLYLVLILFLLTILSEKYSFTRYIEKNPILNWVDQLGRK
ncbi:MAG: phospho-N-acetylmuramoyl-pentapeptide-transferase [Halanaerobiales bacterium]